MRQQFEPIAIVGVGCRFPGGADSPEAYWQLLAEGRDTVQSLDERWRKEGVVVGQDVPRWAGLLTEPLDLFDAAFFGISPREARTLDPQQRMLLEVAWEAFERAGIAPRSLVGSQTGVFLGACSTDYLQMVAAQPEAEQDAYATTGNLLSIAAGRLSYALGLQGPCLTVDTACSSSLVAIHLACRSLRAQESSIALAGGVNLILSPITMQAMAHTQALSPDGRCKTFDASANGYVRGEGCGLVVLKRLRDAERDGDPICALIQGSAINQDGRSTGLTAPNVRAQEELLAQALQSARIGPGAIGYVETHGTGTSLGDTIEVEALRAAIGKARPDGTRCILGAVKTNLGHLEGAAGVAGLLKVVLAFQKEKIPSNLHLRNLNPRLRLEGTSLSLATEMTSWPRTDRPRYAGVSSFGLSGTNSHVILAEPPVANERPSAPLRSAELFVLSARSADGLNAVAGRLAAHLRQHPDLAPADVAFSLATTRSALEHRLSLAATTRDELLAALDAVAEGQTPAGAVRGHVSSTGAPKVVFVFPGQGSQWLGMGKQLLAEEPVFRAAMEACDTSIRAEAGFSILAELEADADASQLNRIDVVQPLLFALEVGLAALWQSWGVTPDAVVGHSMGEVAAAHVSGALSLPDAVAIICRRSHLLRRISGKGEMALLDLPLAEAESELQGYRDRLSVAVSNSQRSTVIAGDPAALSEVLDSLSARGIFCRRVKVDVASHSPQVDELRHDLVAALDKLQPQKAIVAMRSTVTGQWVDGTELLAAYWADNLRQPVRFADAVQDLLQRGHGLFVELSPHPILVPSLEEMLQGVRAGISVGSLRRNQAERAAMLAALGGLWVQGLPIDWNKLFPVCGRRVALPTYPWQREHYWIDGVSTFTVAMTQGQPGAGGHPLLGQERSVSTQAGTHIWETTLDLTRLPWLADHQVQSNIVVPGAAYVEMALAGAAQLFNHSAFAITDVVFMQMLELVADRAAAVQVVMTEEQPGAIRFEVASRIAGDGSAPWQPATTAMVRREERLTLPPPIDLSSLRERMGVAIPGEAQYAALPETGVHYGPAFQGVIEAWKGEGEALGRIRLPEQAGRSDIFQLHPALLDSCFQVMGILADTNDSAPWVLAKAEALRLYQPQPSGEIWCYVQLATNGQKSAHQRSADLKIADSTGALVAEIVALTVQRLSTTSSARAGEEDELFLEVEWEPAPVPVPKIEKGRFVVLGKGGGFGTALRLALETEGHKVVLAEAALEPSAFRALFGEAFEGQAPTAVVHLGSLDVGPELDADAVELALSRGCNSVLAVVQALAAMNYRDVPRLWLLTRGAQPVGNVDVAVAQSPLLGLSRVIAMEHVELRCARLDLDQQASAEEAMVVAAELLADDAEEEIALRDGGRHVSRLVHRVPTRSPDQPGMPIHGDASYLILGGLGGLGLSVAAWLSEQGAGHLVLMGRSGVVNDEQRAAIAALEARGARVTVAEADATVHADVERTIRELATTAMPLRGVIHAAGLLDDGMLVQQSSERLRAVMAPKIFGALHLHLATHDSPLDFFVLYASAAGLFGSPGQSGYAAGNTFLDALAHHRRRKGLPALSIDWGAFSGVGLAAAQDNRGVRLVARGMRSLSPTNGLVLLRRLLDSDRVQVAVVPLNVRQWLEFYPAAASSRRLSPLVVAQRRAGKASGDRALLDRLAAVDLKTRTKLLEDALRAQVSQVLRIPEGKLDVDEPLTSLGMDSLMGLELRNRIEAALGMTIPVTLLWTYPTVVALSEHLVTELRLAREPSAGRPQSAVEKSLVVGTQLREETAETAAIRAQLTELEESLYEPIAVVGMACRFPGGANDPEAFWKLLVEGRDAIRPLDDRWALVGDAPIEDAPRWAGLLTDAVDSFDAAFFGITPREAKPLDPQHRLLLELSWEALESAGIPPRSLMGSRTGVFVGASSNDYAQKVLNQPGEDQDAYSSTGSTFSIAAGRISYTLGLQGPCFVVDTSCSSSLVAIHLACRSLRAKESSVALAAGVNLILSPITMDAMARTQALSPDGRCKTFDASASGFVRGEGGGVVVLKRLRDALRDGDRIWALIRGSAVNQDGRSTGLTAPNVRAQEELLQTALESARLTPDAIGYVETHGTGTSLGDPIEVEALRATVGKVREDGTRCVLGAVKTNLGHLEGAAGIAGLIKAVLVLDNERIPPNLHLRTLNPRLRLDDTALSPATEASPWPRSDRPRFAGVSSFSLSGTNAHVILQEAPATEEKPSAQQSAAELFVLSARSVDALQAAAEKLATHLREHADLGLGDVAFSLATTRSHLEHRLAVTAVSRDELLSALDMATQGQTRVGVSRGAAARSIGKVAFLFTGQGAQVLGMGQALHAEWPVFREAFDQCVELFDRELDQSLRGLMWAEAGDADAVLLDQTAYTQPALFTLEYALWALWRSWGAEPDLVAGHSIGEIVAACVAGVFSLEDAVKLVAARGRLMQALPAGGAMVSIGAPEADVAAAMAPHAALVSIAAVNGPEQVVIAGAEAPVHQIAESFAARGIRTKSLSVSHAFHSPLMDPMLDAFEQVAKTVTYHRPSMGLVSNLNGALITDEVTDPAYWVRHVRQAVRFADGIKALHEAGAEVFLEIGPKPALVGMAATCLPADARSNLIGSLRPQREEPASVLDALGSYWSLGGRVNQSGVFPHGGKRVSLPAYPWQRQRYWIDFAPDRRKLRAQEPVENWLYDLTWPEVSRPAAAVQRPTRNAFLILADHGGLGRALADALSARGFSCQVCLAPDDTAARASCVEKALAERNELHGVVYLWGLDAAVQASASADEVGAATRLATAPVLALLRAMVHESPASRLWVVTRGACAIGAEADVAPCQTALWGLGRTAALEHPEMWGGLVDLDPQTNPSDVDSLVAEIFGSDDEDQIAWRSGRRYAARLSAVSQVTLPTPTSLSSEGSYLVTGGLGALGLHVAKWLVERGAKHLVLTTRQGLPERSTWGEPTRDDVRARISAVQALEAQGARVTVAAIDVADEDAMTAFVTTIDPPLRGVVHAAGVGPWCALAETSDVVLESTLRAKVGGGWVLHRLSQRYTLEMFVLFSSGAAVWGGLGQGAYAAGNAFLDALALHRRAHSLPAVSIDWGVWAEGGMADAEVQARLQSIGVLEMPTDGALSALERVLHAGVANRTVTRMNWARFAAVFTARRNRKLLTQLMGETPRTVVATSKTLPQWQGMSTAEARETVATLVRSVVLNVLGFVDANALDAERGFAEQGMDSLMAVQIRTRLEQEIGVSLSATIAFDHPTVDRLAKHLLTDVLDLEEQTQTVDIRPSLVENEAIAIVGAACRLPGGADDLDAYWALLASGVVTAADVPADRWNAAEWYSPDPNAVGRTYVVRGGFIRDVQGFDADFFRISPREATSLDPQQRLLLEVSWEAIERSGQSPEALQRTSTGVFFGMGTNEYTERLEGRLDQQDAYAGTGNMPSVAAGRVAFFLGLHGPTMVVETACSSSLVALHLACQSLRLGECNQALVGGVNVLLSPRSFMLLSRARALSPDGQCKTFGATADGYGRAEGCAVVVLKRLSDAERAGDRILAVVKGTAINHDGPASGLTVPNGPAQQAVLRDALRLAQIEPADVDFVECHGTGTPLGDPIEVQALGAVYGQGRDANRPLWLGAVKANLGHLEPAAGMAGLLKIVAAFQHEKIPAQPRFGDLNPHVPWDLLPVAVARETVPWARAEKPRRAGLSSFGMSGTNAHVIIEEAPASLTKETRAAPLRSAELLVLSAKSAEALHAAAGKLATYLGEHDEFGLYDIAFSLSTTRSEFSHRLALVGTVREDVMAALKNVAQGQSPAGVVQGEVTRARGKLAFVFTGQGAQVLGMGRGLHGQWTAFATAFDQCAALFDRELERPLRDVMWAEPGSAEAVLLGQTMYTQSALFVLEYALSALWRSWGVEPHLLAGHSIGEIVAATVAGVFSLEDAVKLVAARGRLMQNLPAGGAMVSIAAPEADVAAAIAPHATTVSIAAVNGPAQVVIAGVAENVQSISSSFAERGVRTKSLTVSHAFHSPLMDPMLDAFAQVAASVTYRRPAIDLVSNLTGKLITNEVTEPSYWVRHVREAVRFADGVTALHQSGASIFIEVGPQPVLLGMISDSLPEEQRIVVASLRAGRNEPASLLEALGNYWSTGGDVKWAGVFPWSGKRIPLPTYPWQKKRYWLAGSSASLARNGETTRHPLLGARVPAAQPSALFEAVLDLQDQPWLGDHRVAGRVVLAGAALAEIVRAAAAYGRTNTPEIVDLLLQRQVIVPEVGALRIQVAITEADDTLSATVYSQPTNSAVGAAWVEHATASVFWHGHELASAPLDPGDLQQQCPDELAVATLYQTAAEMGLVYGPTFQGLRSLWRGDGEALAQVALPSGLSGAPYGIHPALLDAAFHAASALATTEAGEPMVPFQIGRFTVVRPGIESAWVHVRLGTGSTAEGMNVDVTLADDAGTVVAQVADLRLQRVNMQALRTEAPSEAFYRLDWRQTKLVSKTETAHAGIWVVVAIASSRLAVALSARLSPVLRTDAAGLGTTLDHLANVAGVVCLWEPGADEPIPSAAQRLATEALSVVQALQGRPPMRLWWVTTHAIAIEPAARIEPASSAVWGLGRTVMLEQPDLKCTLVDLEPGDESLESLVQELSASDNENQIVWRAEHRYAARLVRAVATEAGKFTIPAQSTVLITGGLGGLGQHMARWLAGQGVEHLVLTSRRGLETPGASEIVEDLAARGTRVTIAAVDVADRQTLLSMLEAIPSDEPLRGVIHAAGVLDDGIFTEQTPERIARVFAPKVAGAWNLHELTRGQPLEFFVMISSVAGVVGSPGQSNYGAANAFLDALAWHRKTQGLPAQSLAWGPWAEVGMAAELGTALQTRLSRQGIKALTPTEGISLLGRALGRTEAQLVVVPLDVVAMGQTMGNAVPPIWRALVRSHSDQVSAGRPETWFTMLAPLAPEHRAREVRRVVIEDVARVLSFGAPNDLSADRPLKEMGLDSLMAVELRNALGRRVSRPLPATLAFDYPTVDAITQYLLKEIANQGAPAAITKKPARASTVDEPIAIVGMACRYPGGITTPESFWHLLDQGIDAVTEMPHERWDVDALYDPDPTVPGKMMTRQGGFVANIDQFDPAFFGITPREAVKMDPQQRLLLETSWEALESAGIAPERWMGSETGVFVGLMYQEYSMLAGGLEDLDGYVGTGSAASVASGRLSYLLGLTGPSLTVDTACSSSLVTVHLACQALRRGECSAALAGGVALMLTPTVFVEFSRLRGLAPDGRSKSFSAKADGVGWSEGCGMLVLKRLSDAKRDGDPILAVIRGSAVNQDGRSQGLTAPNGPSQQAVIRKALEQAGVAPADVGYVECHGTGTTLGDPIEVQALGTVLAEGRDPQRPIVIGSVKSNMGHTQAAAGVAGIIKTILSFAHERIPKSLHFDVPSPHIPWAELPVEVASEAKSWPRGRRRRIAGVSSFGVSGTNAHVVLEEPPIMKQAPATNERPAELFVLSAKNPEALNAAAARLEAHLGEHADVGLYDLAFSLATTRSPLEHRLSMAATTREDLLAMLKAAAEGQAIAGVSRGKLPRARGQLAFLFTGQGAQVLGMGRELHAQWPAFRDAFDRCVTLFDRALDRPLREVMWADAGHADAVFLDQTAYTQPALFTLEYALAALWRFWGVEPDLVAGHSIGEIVAACVAGVFSLEDAVKLVAARGRLMQDLPAGGAMISIAAPEAEVAAAIASLTTNVAIAAVNGPEQVVIAGAHDAVHEIAASFAARGIRTKALQVSHAFHSPLMDPMLEAFAQVANSITYHPPSIALVSNLSGKLVTDEVTGPAYWVRHVREAVRFADGVQAAHEAGVEVFVEVGPKPVLLGMVPACLSEAKPLLVPSLRAGRESTSILEALGSYWSVGGMVHWAGFFPVEGKRVPLPTYPWQRDRYWIERPRVRSAKGTETQGVASEYYDAMSRVGIDGSDDGSGTEIYLTFGPFLEIVPGYSWIVTAAKPKDNTDHARITLEAQRRMRAVLFRHVDFASCKRALDFGCGYGTDLLILGGKHPHLELHGYTISADQARVGHQRAVKAGLAERVSIHHRDSAKNDFPKACDLIFGFEVAHHIRDKRALFHNIGDHLVPNGLLVLADFISNVTFEIEHEQSSSFFLKKEQWVEVLSQHGLCVVDCVDASQEIANFLHDSDFDRHIEELPQFADPNIRTAFKSYDQLGKMLRRGLASYVLMTAKKEADLSRDELKRRNREALEELLPFALFDELGQRRRTEDEWLLELAWEPAPVPVPKVQAGRFVLLGGQNEFGRALRLALETAGHQVAHHIGRDVRAFLGEVFGGRAPTAVVHLGSLGIGEELDVASVENALSLGCDSVLSTVQALAATNYRDVPRLWLVTRGAQAMGATDVCVAQAPVLGLGRVIAMEHAELRCGRFDLDKLGSPNEVEAVVAELLADDPEEEVALRGNTRYVARLVHRAPSRTQTNDVPIRSDGSYLITGGLGGLGLSVAQWLADQGAGHLVLMGRSGAASAEQRAAIEALQNKGARVTIAKADVAKLADVERAIQDIAASGLPLRGVIHAAGVLDDGIILQQTPARFRTVMAPKVQGALNLHESTREIPLDFFVLYSSASGFLGSPGQSNYAAANSFLDALAHHRKAHGLPALCIDWGAFSDVGLAAAQENRGARLVARGMNSLTPDQGLTVLRRLLESDRVQVAVVPLNVRQWVEFYPAVASSRRLSRLVLAHQSNERRASGDRVLLDRLAAATSKARTKILQDALRAQASLVLRIPEVKLDVDAPLTSLGMDSLMGLELRNRIEAVLGLTIPATLLWTYPTVVALSEYLVGQVVESQDQPPDDIANPSMDVDDTSDLGDLNDKDALYALLDEELSLADKEMPE